MEQAVQRGYRAVIASPDKDFKQLISENVQIVIPLADLNRWSFYTLKHYHAQYNCDPQSDLSFRKCLNLVISINMPLNLSCYLQFCFVKCQNQLDLAVWPEINTSMVLAKELFCIFSFLANSKQDYEFCDRMYNG